MEEARVLLGQEMYADMQPSLAALRLSRGYSQQQLANALGTSQSHIAKIEAGLVSIQWETGVRIAGALGITLDELQPLIAFAVASGKK